VSHPASTVELLAWLAARPRTYRETLEAWRTSCPRLPVWEDALADGLVEVRHEGSRGVLVGLTGAGRAVLDDVARGAVASR
jgi:hypothetical protein